jgi:hypothetical protein
LPRAGGRSIAWFFLGVAAGVAGAAAAVAYMKSPRPAPQPTVQTVPAPALPEARGKKSARPRRVAD